MRKPILAGAALAAALHVLPAAAHDSPVHRIDELTLAIAADPRSATLHLERAELYRVLRQWPEGLSDLQAAARLAPEMAAVHLATASLLLQADAPAAALDAVDRFLAADDTHAEGRLLRARILRRSGRNLDAAADFSRGISLASMHSRATPEDFLDRAVALADEGRLDEALGGLDDGIAALGAPITLELAAIDLEIRRTDYDAALRRLASIEAKASRRESWSLRRAEVLALAGRRDEAAAACEEALARIAALPARLHRLAATVALEGKVRAKLEALRTASGDASPSATSASAGGGRS